MIEDDDEEYVLPELTPLQERYLGYIEDCILNRWPPTRQELADHFGTTNNAAQEMVLRLVKLGRLKILRHIPRGIRIADP